VRKQQKPINELTREEIIALAKQFLAEDRKSIDSREYQLTHFAKRSDYLSAENMQRDISGVIRLNDLHNIPCIQTSNVAWEEMNAVREVLDEEKRVQKEEEEHILALQERLKEIKREERAANNAFWEFFITVKDEEEKERLMVDYWARKEARSV